MDKRILLIVEPAVKHLKPIHQPSRIAAEIRLPETELIVIDARTDRFLVYSFFRDIPQRILDHPDKSFFLLHVGIFRYHGENGLVNAIVIGAHDIFADPRVKERFFQRSAGRGQQRIVQDLKTEIKLFV